MTDIKTIVAKINKTYGENTIGFASELRYSEILRLPSGSLFLDWALGENKKQGVSGWALGTIVELYGPESSGKSLISLKTIAEAQKRGFVTAYFDCEKSFDKNFAESLGVDTESLIVSRESVLEKAIDLACGILKEYPETRVIVFDSVATMIPTSEIEKPLDQKGQMAAVATAMSMALRKLNYYNKNKALLIFINQLREKPGVSYGNPEYTPGGRALKFYSSIRAEIRRGDWLYEDDDKKKPKIGQSVKFKIVKNKTDVAQRDGYFNFFYSGEIDKYDELFSLGLLRDRIERKGPYYVLCGKTSQGKESLLKMLKEDKAFYEEAVKDIMTEKGGE